MINNRRKLSIETLALMLATDAVNAANSAAVKNGYDTIRLAELTAHELLGFSQDMVKNPKDFEGAFDDVDSHPDVRLARP